MSTIHPALHVHTRQNDSLSYLTSRTKRLIDIVGAIFGLILGFPIFAVASLIVIFVDGVPPIFRQDRVGLHGEAFSIIKLRTLPVDETRVPSAKRIANKPQYETTRTGKFWRRHSIDEIMQFWLVLRGDMSLIGHRPIPMYYLSHLPDLDGMTAPKAEQYIKTISQYKPGMSSLSSVNGRGNLSMLEKMGYDREYLDSASLWLDLQLLIRSVYVVITCTGAK